MSERDIHGRAHARTELTESDVTSLRVRNLSGYILCTKRGTSSAPTTMDGSIRLRPNDIFFEENRDLRPGGSGGRVRGNGANGIHASLGHE